MIRWNEWQWRLILRSTQWLEQVLLIYIISKSSRGSEIWLSLVYGWIKLFNASSTIRCLTSTIADRWYFTMARPIIRRRNSNKWNGWDNRMPISHHGNNVLEIWGGANYLQGRQRVWPTEAWLIKVHIDYKSICEAPFWRTILVLWATWQRR